MVSWPPLHHESWAMVWMEIESDLRLSQQPLAETWNYQGVV